MAARGWGEGGGVTASERGAPAHAAHTLKFTAAVAVPRKPRKNTALYASSGGNTGRADEISVEMPHGGRGAGGQGRTSGAPHPDRMPRKVAVRRGRPGPAWAPGLQRHPQTSEQARTTQARKATTTEPNVATASGENDTMRHPQTKTVRLKKGGPVTSRQQQEPQLYFLGGWA